MSPLAVLKRTPSTAPYPRCLPDPEICTCSLVLEPIRQTTAKFRVFVSSVGFRSFPHQAPHICPMQLQAGLQDPPMCTVVDAIETTPRLLINLSRQLGQDTSCSCLFCSFRTMQVYLPTLCSVSIALQYNCSSVYPDGPQAAGPRIYGSACIDRKRCWTC